MNADLAQTIALTAYGNAFLNGSKYAQPPELSQTNSTFQLVSSVRFVREEVKSGTGKREIDVARNTAGWFEDLRARKATRLWLIIFEVQHTHVPPNIAVALSGFSGWAMQVDMESGYEFWVPHWESAQQNAQHRRVWDVRYRGIFSNTSGDSAHLDVSHSISDLRGALEAAEQFARKAYVDFWADWFTNALSQLDSVEPIPPFHVSILPKMGYNLRARQLMAAAVQSFVFGGMGSWNDLSFSDEELQYEYVQVTRNLYKAVMGAFVAATNAYDANVGALTV